jgi:hypothetical protein
MSYDSIANRKKAMPYDDDETSCPHCEGDGCAYCDGDDDDDHPSLTAAERNPSLR